MKYRSSASVLGAPARVARLMILALLVFAAFYAALPVREARALGSAAPVIFATDVTSGPINGGTTVVIEGQNFTSDGTNSNVTSIKIGTTPVPVYTVNSDQQITITTPDNSVTRGGTGPGNYPVTVTTSNAPTATSPDSFVYFPVVTGVKPKSGTPAGTETVTITGLGFEYRTGGALAGAVAGADKVCFGHQPVIGCYTGQPGKQTITQDTSSNTGDSTLTVNAPPHQPGTVDVTVVVNKIESPSTPDDTYTYSTGTPPPPPATAAGIFSVSNQDNVDSTNQGINCCTSGDRVQITGTNFNGDLRVSFGNPGTPNGPSAGCPSRQDLTLAEFSQAAPNGPITAIAPVHGPGTIDVAVSRDGGQTWSPCNRSTSPGTPPADEYTYAVPSVSGVSPTTGPSDGGTTVTIDGDQHGTDSTGTTYSEAFKDGQSIVDFRDATTGRSEFACTDPSNPKDHSAYTTPKGTAANPGDPNCKLVTDKNGVHIQVPAPAHPAGLTYVHVSNFSGRSPEEGNNNRFVYIAGVPVVNSVSPTSGPSAGGTTVVIKGLHLGGATYVQFGDASHQVSCVNNPSRCSSSPTQITVLTPAHPAGPVPVQVNTAGGTSAPNGPTYTYTGPTVSSVSPAQGPVAGGNQVTVTGEGFFNGGSACAVSRVDFGSTPATGVTCTDDSHLTATAPAATSSGPVHVRVTTPGGTSPTSNADLYTYAGAPTVGAVSPTTGGVPGGNQVQIIGSGFWGGSNKCNVTRVSFGKAVVSPPFVDCTNTSLTVTSPASLDGANPVDIQVQTGNGGTSATNPADVFTYQHGYNILTGPGGIYSFGDAGYYGNLIDNALPGQGVGLAEMPDGKGYYILTSDGNLYTFGSANGHYHGNLNVNDSGRRFPGVPVAVAATKTGDGYVIVTADGGFYSFGDANFYDGNMISRAYPGTTTGFAFTASGKGYWFLTQDGAIYSFGDAGYYGNLIDHSYPGRGVSLTRSADGAGYQILTSEGNLYSFGDAAGQYYGNLNDHGYPTPGVAISETP